MALCLSVGAACDDEDEYGLPPGPTAGDRDGDGVTDRSDVCPDIPDPAQVDPDGDGVGWACDPVETINFAGAPQRVRGMTVVANNGTDVLGVSVAGLQTGTHPGTAAISTHGKVYWLSSTGVDEHDLTNGEFVDRGRIASAAEETYPELRSFAEQMLIRSASNVFEPQADGSLRDVGGGTNVGAGERHPMTGDILRLVTTGSSSALTSFAPGASTMSPLSVNTVELSGLTSAQRIAWDGGRGPIAYSYERGGSAFSTRFSMTQTVVSSVPWRSTSGVAVDATTQLLRGVSGGAVLVRDNDRLLDLDTTFTDVDATGTEALTLVTATSGGVDTVWAVVPNGTEYESYEVATGLTNAHVAARNGVGYVRAQRAGDYVVLSYRNGMTEEFPFAAPIVDLQITGEGAALVATGTSLYAISTTGVVLLTEVAPPIRISAGSVTVFEAMARNPPVNKRLYAYDENAGQPRISTLVPSDRWRGLHNPGTDELEDALSSWLFYSATATGSSAVECNIARVTDAPTAVPQLTSVAKCASGTLLKAGMLGTKPVLADTGVYLLDGTTVTTLVPAAGTISARSVTLLSADSSLAVAGWAGTRDDGGFLCLASETPGRCWSTPAMSGLSWWIRPASGSTPAFIHLAGASDNKLVSIRTMGEPNRDAP